MRTIYLILKDDAIHYPPILSIIHILLKFRNNVVLIGNYSDVQQRQFLENRGIIFHPVIQLRENVSLLSKLVERIIFRKQVYSYLFSRDISSSDYIWIFHTETLCLLNKLPNRYSVIFHPLEFVDSSAIKKYKILSPALDLTRLVHKVNKVVCCEYNRAQITKGIFSLQYMPYIMPNKMYISDKDLRNVPADIQEIIDSILPKLENKKVILYQGIFLTEERRLEEFCEAIQNMSDNYVLIAMGKGSKYYDDLKEKYQSEKIIFMPFIRPPYHLLVTEKASIGILTYFPKSKNISSVINPIYCAPNKIFEYSRYGIPMISNDIPGLYYIFMQYKCGEVIPYPVTAERIRIVIEKIYSSYDKYSKGAYQYYDSIDLESIIAKILN